MANYLHNKNAAAKMYIANGEKTKHDIEYENYYKIVEQL